MSTQVENKTKIKYVFTELVYSVLEKIVFRLNYM